MNDLCVLLPVHNAQDTLSASASELLEILPELAWRFELHILDDGSTDDTIEVAHELAAEYPQIRVMRHPVRLGLAEVIQTGLDHTRGDLILVGDQDYQLDPEDLRALWQLRETQRNMSNSRLPAQEPWMRKLLAWKPRRLSTGQVRSFGIIHRAVYEQYRLEQALEMITRVDQSGPARKAAGRPNFLGRMKQFAWGE